jgi:succinate dehydrogenase/fumarate reductase cytochrome b subunit
VGLQRRLRFWLLPLLGVVAYPTVLTHFAAAIYSYRETGAPALAVSAALLMLVAGSIPVISGRALILISQDDSPRAVLTRSLLYLAFSVSPLYVLSILLAAKAGVVQHHGVVWTASWTVLGLVLCTRESSSASPTSAAGLAWLRIMHGATAVCLLLGFLVAHVINHDLAIWNVRLHGTAMEWLRLWYRSDWVEPVLFALFAAMIATGAPLVVRHSRRSTDAFRMIQLATGVYIALFLCAHVLAVLSARNAGKETDWIFATGPNGLLDGRGMLIPYYVFAVLFLALHVGCGLRVVLLKHGVTEARANQAVYAVAAVGCLATTVIAIAALGFSIEGS